MNDSNAVEMLWIEDNPQDLDLSLRALRRASLDQRVQIARDGAEALDFVFCEGAFSARRISDSPKLILLDLKLPKVDGLEVLRRLKSDPRTKTIPVVVFTSSREHRDVVESHQLGVNSYIVKPVSLELLTSAVRDLGHYWLHLNQPPTVAD